jgi:predicted transcriptional regulator
MLPKLEQINHTRKRLGLTQRKLASMVDVSPSLINQIESGRSKPSYETARRIFEVLNDVEGKSSIKVGEICNRNIIAASPNDTASKVAELMRRHGFSQIPILDDNKALGLISEENIMHRMITGDSEIVGRTQISKMFDAAPPVVDLSTPSKAIIPLIRYSKAVLVSEKGKIIGIITAADLLKLID